MPIAKIIDSLRRARFSLDISPSPSKSSANKFSIFKLVLLIYIFALMTRQFITLLNLPFSADFYVLLFSVIYLLSTLIFLYLNQPAGYYLATVLLWIGILSPFGAINPFAAMEFDDIPSENAIRLYIASWIAFSIFSGVILLLLKYYKSHFFRKHH